MAEASFNAEEPPTAAAAEEAEADAVGGPTDLLLLKKAERRRQRDLYTALNLEEGASAEDVRGAYLRLAALMHPDKHGGGSELRTDAEEVRRFGGLELCVAYTCNCGQFIRGIQFYSFTPTPSLYSNSGASTARIRC